jgi:hypothetical protein
LSVFRFSFSESEEQGPLNLSKQQQFTAPEACLTLEDTHTWPVDSKRAHNQDIALFHIYFFPEFGRRIFVAPD